MKDGTTHLAFKAENAVDVESSAVVSAGIFPADQGDAQTISETVEQSLDNLKSMDSDKSIVHLVTDKGYHKAALIEELYWEQGITTYIPERKSSQRRKWKGNDKRRRAFHANRNRCKSEYGKWLIR